MNDHRDKCAGCGRAIIWARTETGARIPLDAVAPVYFLDGKEEGPAGLPHALRAETTYVSHFATCPQAAQFSGRNRDVGQEQQLFGMSGNAGGRMRT